MKLHFALFTVLRTEAERGEVTCPGTYLGSGGGRVVYDLYPQMILNYFFILQPLEGVPLNIKKMPDLFSLG